jgi:hypothetical protein
MAKTTRPAWERKEGEPNLWYQRFETFRAMGPTRSLTGAANRERVQKSQKESGSPPGSWRNAAKLWKWHARAEAWDMHISQEASRLAEAERLEVLREGFALDHIRVRSLKKLALALEGQIQEPDKLWLPDVKSIGSGENAERVDLVRFNSPLIEQFRGTLADIADEVGGRKKNGIDLNLDLSGLTTEQLERIANGEDPLKVLSATQGRG